MLPRPHRLPSLKISHVLRYARRVTGDSMQLVFVKGESDVSRFAFIVSTKIDKRATVRNRMRRVLSESVRHVLPQMVTPIDCVVFGSRQLVGLGQDEVELKVKDVLKQTGCL